MRIVYGVTGEGLGHAMRAQAVARRLVARGHTVKLAASGRSVALLEGHGFDVARIDGFSLAYGAGALRRGKTLLDNARRAPQALLRNAEVARDEIEAFRPDAFLTDFDSFTYVLARLSGLPIVSLDHQHALSRLRHDRAVMRAVSRDFFLSRAVVAAKVPRCAHYVVTSFFRSEVRPRYARSTTLVGPILRERIAELTPTSGEHVVVYQTASGDGNLLSALAEVKGARFVVYGLGRQPARGSVSFCAFDERAFLDDLASARAVITNGGTTTLAEALALGKPVLSIPIRHQGEQELNAAYLSLHGLGERARRAEPAVISRFLDRAPGLARPPAPLSAGHVEDAADAVERALLEAA